MKLLRVVILIIVASVISHSAFASQAMLQQAWGEYLKGDYLKALSRCREIADDKTLGEEGRYIMGLSFLKLDRPDEARKNFTFIIDNYKRASMRSEAILGIADSYFIEGNFQKSEEYYRKLLRENSSTGYASIAYLRLGESQLKQGKWQESEESFSKILRDYPLSLEVDDAKKYLKRDISYFTIQVGAFSKRTNADKCVRTLSKKGHSAYVEKGYRKDKLLYRVKIGQFNTKEEANRMASKLKRQGFATRINT
ncbi:SPOR domain-containing protein [Candidatus Omnitrophota bacterium]